MILEHFDMVQCLLCLFVFCGVAKNNCSTTDLSTITMIFFIPFESCVAPTS